MNVAFILGVTFFFLLALRTHFSKRRAALGRDYLLLGSFLCWLNYFLVRDNILLNVAAMAALGLFLGVCWRDWRNKRR